MPALRPQVLQRGIDSDMLGSLPQFGQRLSSTRALAMLTRSVRLANMSRSAASGVCLSDLGIVGGTILAQFSACCLQEVANPADGHLFVGGLAVET